MIHSCLVWFLWWLRHGAIGPFEATPVGVNVDWPEFWIHTFELVIRLGKVQQMALLFCTISVMSRWSFGPRVPRRNACLSQWSRSKLPETVFLLQLLLSQWQINQDMIWTTGRHTTFRCCLFLLMVVWWGETYCAPNSLELESRFMPLWLTWTRAWSGTIARILGLGTESCFPVLFSPTSSPLVPYLMLSSLPR